MLHANKILTFRNVLHERAYALVHSREGLLFSENVDLRRRLNDLYNVFEACLFFCDEVFFDVVEAFVEEIFDVEIDFFEEGGGLGLPFSDFGGDSLHARELRLEFYGEV